MKQGFTLIELLVVVLIIGILSSVALPQYEKSVNKARGAEAVIAAKTVADSANLYFLERRQYPTSQTELTVKAPDLKNFTLTLNRTSATQLSVLVRSNKGAAVITVDCQRGKINSRYCTGADCSSYFSCRKPASGETVPAGGCLL